MKPSALDACESTLSHMYKYRRPYGRSHAAAERPAHGRMKIDDQPPKTIVLIYRRRWQIKSLFKQIKQNLPLRYFYGKSSNAIKIQIWVTLIANLLMTLLQKSLVRKWSFSGLATIVRIVLMYYINLDSFLKSPVEDLKEC